MATYNLSMRADGLSAGLVFNNAYPDNPDMTAMYVCPKVEDSHDTRHDTKLVKLVVLG